VNRKEKERIVKELEDKFSRSASSVFAEFRGLNVQRMEDLRKRSREAKIEFQVIKNTLAERAFQLLDFKDTIGFFAGPTGVAFGWDDPITPIKVLSEFAKDNPQLVLKGGVIEKAIVSEEKLGTLASLPPKEILLSQIVMSIQSPLNGLVNVLNGPIRGLLNCLKAIEQKNS
jgi:large subunit ribosomal protein L10